MHILFLLSRIEKNGVTLHTLDLAKGLIDQGHQLTMFTGGVIEPDNKYLLKIEKDFVDIGVQTKIFKTPKGNIISKVFISISSILILLRWILKLKADIIHCQSPYMTFLPWLIGKKFVTTVHNVTLVQNLKYKNPTRLIAISSESKTYGIETLRASSETVDTVFHGISNRYSISSSEAQKKQLRLKHNIANDALVIGYVGRLTIEKGLDVLVRAVEKYLSTAKEAKVELAFLGDYFNEEDKIWLADLQEECSNVKIHMIDFQDPKPIYDIFDIFVLPSNSEAFGLVCIESMMSNCCTVRTDTIGAIDQIEDGVDGFIFPVGDVNALTAIFDKIIPNEALRKTIAERGQQTALENFTIEAMTLKTIEVYKKVTRT
ncbi:MAG: glycosyltransferase family 4 protein [Maribacter sp.]